MSQRFPVLRTASAGIAAWLWLCASPASAQVQRCTAMDGSTVYTDRRCEDIGAMDRLPDARSKPPATTNSTLGRTGCSRTLGDLVYRISGAINAQDVNRLAGVYQWRGVSNGAADRILDQLENIVQRPLVDIAPVRPQQAPAMDPPDEGETSSEDGSDDGVAAQASRPPHPVGLRIQQTLRNSATPSSTVFGLRRDYNCFWITL